MTTLIDTKNVTIIGLPDEANTTTSANEQPSTQPYRPTSMITNFCDAVDREIASIVVDYRYMDGHSTGASDNAKGIYSATFGGLSASVMGMVSGTLRIAPTLFRHPIDTTAKIVHALPAGIKQMGDDAKRGVNLIREGRYAEGTFVLSKSGTDIAAALTGATGVAKGATSLLEKGAQIAFREITAAADAVNTGSGGAMATVSSVSMTEDAAVAVQTATASTSGSGPMSAPLLMSATQTQSNAQIAQGKVQSKTAYIAKLKELDDSIASLKVESETLQSKQVSWLDRHVTKTTASRIKAIDKHLSVLREEREAFIKANQEWVIMEEFFQAGASGRVNLGLLRVETVEQFDRILREFDSAQAVVFHWRAFGPEPQRLLRFRRTFIEAHPEMNLAPHRLAFERISWPTDGHTSGAAFHDPANPQLVLGDQGNITLMVDTRTYQPANMLGSTRILSVRSALIDKPLLTPVQLADDLWVVLFEKRRHIGGFGNEFWAVFRSEGEAAEFVTSRAAP